MKYAVVSDPAGNVIGRCSILGTTYMAVDAALARVGRLAARHAGVEYAGAFGDGYVFAFVGHDLSGPPIATFCITD